MQDGRTVQKGDGEMMKRIMIFAIIALMLIPCVSLADGEPEVITISIIPTPTPEPAPTPTPDVRPMVIEEHELDEDDVEAVARLLWSSPLRDKTQKAALAWLACNRADASVSGDTISSNINTSEFSFYDRKAHLSDENKEIASLVLNQWLSEKDGCKAGRLIPKKALYLDFTGYNNRELVLLAERGGEPMGWPIKDAYDYKGGAQ
jgi:hypothetical protein